MKNLIYSLACLLALGGLPAQAQIKVYTMNGCGRCAFAVKYLKEKNVEFAELNTTTSDANNSAMWAALDGKASGTITMPVIDNNGDVAFSIPNLSQYVENLATNAGKKTGGGSKNPPKKNTEDAQSVVIFEHSNFEGASQSLKIGRYNLEQLQIGNDQLSSVKVPQGLAVLLYEHRDFTGAYMILTENETFVGEEFNDLTSSIVVMRAEDLQEPEEPKEDPKEEPSDISFKGCATGKEEVPADNEAFEKRLLELVNAERKKAGKPALVWNANLARAARYHAADMATEDYFEHDSHDVINGVKTKVCGTFERISKFGKGYAENIAWGSQTPEAAMKQWMNSPGHKRNILSDNASMGAGFYKGYWVQVFGSK